MDNRNRRGGGGLNSQENFCVKEPENGLDNGKSPNLKPVKNTQKFPQITLKNSHKNDENNYLKNNAKNNCINESNKNLYNNKNNHTNDIKDSNLINRNNYENSSFNRNECDTNLYQQCKNEIDNNNDNIKNFNLDNKDNCEINYNENIKNCDFNNTNIYKINSKNSSTSNYNENVSGITNTPNYKNVNLHKNTCNTNLYQQHQIKNSLNKNYKIVPDVNLYQVQNKLNNTTNSPTSQNTLTLSFPQKIIAIIVSLALIISLLGSGTYFLLSFNNSKATTSNTLTVSTNLYNTDGTINSAAAKEILTAIGYWGHENDTGTYKAHQISTRETGETATGATVTFPMGYYVSKAGEMDTSKPIYWQAVYLSNGYLTIWMNNNYTYDYFNYGTSTSSGWGNGTQHNSSDYSNYSRSTLRDITNNIYTALSGKLTNFSSIIQSPSEAKATWQQTEKEDVYTRYPNKYDHHNNLYYSSTSSYGGSFTDWPHGLWDNSSQPYSDKFWIPSSAEVFNNVSGSSNQGEDKGLWGLTATDRGFKSTNNSETGNSQTTIEGSDKAYYTWLRSGNSWGANYAVQIAPTGSAYGDSMIYHGGVRPACHISLNYLYNISIYCITTKTINCNVDKTSIEYMANSNIAQTITFTPSTNRYINSVTIGATDGNPAQTNITINNSQPSNYTTITNLCKCKVYRDGNTVKVVVNELTEPITIVGSANAMTMTISSGSNLSNLNWSRNTYLNTTATISVTLANGYYPQLSYNSLTPVKASGFAGKGSIGSVQYNYIFVNNVLNLTLTNLPTGANNIPTLNLTAYTLDNYDITVNAPNCVYEIIYESTQIIIDVVPNSGRYITQAYVGRNAPEEISCYNGVLTKTGASHSIEYYANDETNEVIFIVRKLRGNITLNLVLGNTKPILSTSSGTKIDGVALQTKLAGSSDTLACVGKATITGYTTTDGLDDVIVYATASAGYKFDHWEIDGAALDTSTYGISAYIPYEMLDGKILVAVFAPNTTNTNDNTNTPDNGGFV